LTWPPKAKKESIYSTGEVRKPLVIPLILFTLVCWAWIIVMARDMYGPMTGASAWMMTLRWDAAHVFLLWAMWGAMMAAMMLPSASPMLLLYGGAAKRQGIDARASAERQLYALAAGYVAVWVLFSIGATAMQRILSMLLLFVGGVMNLAVIAALTVVVAFEKISPFGVAGARISGVLLMSPQSGCSFDSVMLAPSSTLAEHVHRADGGTRQRSLNAVSVCGPRAPVGTLGLPTMKRSMLQFLAGQGLLVSTFRKLLVRRRTAGFGLG
jgi:predicted metal-binding membrane protein